MELAVASFKGVNSDYCLFVIEQVASGKKFGVFDEIHEVFMKNA